MDVTSVVTFGDSSGRVAADSTRVGIGTVIGSGIIGGRSGRVDVASIATFGDSSGCVTADASGVGPRIGVVAGV